jgi:hypothetical protein
MTLKEMEIIGPPGALCVVLKNNAEGQPVKGLAWGPFSAEGSYRLIIDTADAREVTTLVYDNTPAMVKQLEEYWHLNSEG